jgi:hypothetical protein
LEKKVFMGGTHELVKVMAEGKIQFPISREDIISRAGSLKTRVEQDKYIPLRDIIQKIEMEYFDCAAAFYNAYAASIWTEWIKTNDYKRRI